MSLSKLGFMIVLGFLQFHVYFVKFDVNPMDIVINLVYKSTPKVQAEQLRCTIRLQKRT